MMNYGSRSAKPTYRNSTAKSSLGKPEKMEEEPTTASGMRRDMVRDKRLLKGMSKKPRG